MSDADRIYDAQMTLRRAMASLGFAEARSLSLIGEKSPGIFLTGASEASFRRLKNPMNDDQTLLRPSLLSGAA